jgi:hypothetical protein
MKIIKIYETKDAETVEKCVISQIKALRYKKRKDFYQIDLKLLTRLIKDCNKLTLKYKGSVINNVKKNSKKSSKTNSKNTQNGGEQVNFYLYLQKDI